MKAVSGPVRASSISAIRKKWKAVLSSASCAAVFGLLLLAPASPPAHALEAISLADVTKAFETAAPTKPTQVSAQGDTALVALRDFVQGLSSRQDADGADAYSGLRA